MGKFVSVHNWGLEKGLGEGAVGGRRVVKDTELVERAYWGKGKV